MATEHTSQRRFLVESRGVQPLTFKAVLFQRGESTIIDIKGNEDLSKGVTYLITRNDNNEDLTTIGAESNLAGTYFVSNGNYYNLFSADLKLSFDRGAPVLNILENTLGYTPYCVYGNPGAYMLNCVGNEFQNYLANKTPVIIKINQNGVGLFENSTNVRGAFSYEEGLVYIIAYLNYDNSSEDNLLNDGDNFFRTSIEIEVYI